MEPARIKWPSQDDLSPGSHSPMQPADLSAVRARVLLPHCVHDTMRLLVEVEQSHRDLELERLRRERAEFLLWVAYREEQRRNERATS
jgi:hypothetical protein